MEVGMKKIKLKHRILCLILTLTLVCTELPFNTLTVSANESQDAETTAVQETSAQENIEQESNDAQQSSMSQEMISEVEGQEETADYSSENQDTTVSQPPENSTTLESAEVQTDVRTETEIETAALVESATEIEENLPENGENPTTVKGKIWMPEGAFIEGGELSGNLYISAGGYSGRSYFSISGDAEYAEYEITFNAEVATASQIQLNLGTSSSVKTNLVQRTLYYTGSGWSINSADAAEMALPADGGSLDFAFQKSLLYGYVKLPGDVMIDGGRYSYQYRAYVYAETSSSKYSVSGYIDETEGMFYNMSDLPLNTVDITRLYVNVSDNGSINSNLVTNNNEYYNGSGTLTASVDNAIPVSLADGSVKQDLTLRKAEVFGHISLPEGTVIPEDSSISGTVYARVAANGSRYNKSFTVNSADAAAGVDYVINTMPFDLTEMAGLYVNISDITNNTNYNTNLLTGIDEYYAFDADGNETLAGAASETPIQIREDGYNINLKKTNAHFKVMLGDNAQFSGDDLTGTFYVKFKDSNSTYSKNIVINESTKETEFYINKAPVDAKEVSQIYVRWNSNANITSNFMLNKNLYYTGIEGSWADTSVNLTDYSISGETVNELTMSAAADVLKIKMSLPENSEVNGAALEGMLTAYYSGGNYSAGFKIKPQENAKEVTIPLPEGTSKLTYLKVRVNDNSNVSTDVLCNTDLYYTASGLSKEYGGREELVLANVPAEGLGIKLLKTYNISGKISLPENGYVVGNDMTGQIEVRVGNSTYRKYFTFSKDDVQVKYCIPIPDPTETITYLRVYINSRSNTVTNIYTNTYLYYTDDGWTTDSAAAKVITVSGQDTVQDIALEKTKSVNGTIKLPADAFVRLNEQGQNPNLSDDYKKLTGTVRVDYTKDSSNSYQNGSFSIDAQNPENAEYHVILPTDALKITRVSFYINRSSYIDTNLCTNTNMYLLEDGSLSTDSTNAASAEFSSMEIFKDAELLSQPTLSGNIKLAEDGYFRGGRLNGCIYVYPDNGSSVSFQFTMEEEQEQIPYQFVLPMNAAAIRYAEVRLSGQLPEGAADDAVFETNMQLGDSQYFNIDGAWAVNTDVLDEVGLVQKHTEYEIVLPVKKTVSGQISIPEGASFTGGDLTGTISYYAGYRNYSYEFTIPEGQTFTEYSIELPAMMGKASYLSVSLNTYRLETDIVSDTIYQGNDGVWKNNSSNLEPISLQGSSITKNIMLERKKYLKGTIMLPEDKLVENGSISGQVNAKVNGSLYSSHFSISQNTEDLQYSIELPAGTFQLENVSVSLSAPDYVTTNLLLGSSYYSSTLGGWGAAYMQATPVPVTDSETILDVEIKKSVVLSGTLKLGSGSYFRGTNLSGFIRAYVGDVSYVAYFTLEEGSKETNYKIQLPWDSESVSRIQIKAYANSALDTDIKLDTELYLTDRNLWTTDAEKAMSVEINENIITKDLILPMANIIRGTVSAPEGLAFNSSGTVYVVSNNLEYKQEFTMHEGAAGYKIDLPPESGQKYKLYYRLDDKDSEVMAVGNVYVNADGSYDLLGDLAPEQDLGNGTQIRNITLAKWSDFDTDILLESPHPYDNSREYSMEYTYPGTADSLTLHFSKYTSTESNFDDIIIYDTAENIVGQYSGTNLAGKEITVPDKGFKIVISSDSESAYYGFAIDSITAVNGNYNGDLALSVVYENEEASGMMIHNKAADSRNFYVSTASYDDFGKMLDLATSKVKVTGSMAYADLKIIQQMDASSGKLMLYDENFVPLCTEQYKAYPKFELVFDYNDGIGSERAVYLSSKAKVTPPVSQPIRNGYAFTGWYTNEECTILYEFGNSLTEDITLYAGWQEQYSLDILTEGSGELVSEQLDGAAASSGKEISILAVPDEGWIFDAWEITGMENTAQTGNVLTFVMPAANVSILAKFKREADIEWISTGLVNSGNKEIAFIENYLYAPEGTDTITLKGKVKTSQKAVTALSYVYSYYTMDEMVEENYIVTDETDAALDENGQFTLADLPVGIGTNSLILNLKNDSGIVTSIAYYIIGQAEFKFTDDADLIDPDNDNDALKIKDLAGGIVAYWIYDNETPDDLSDDRRVLIVDKAAEIAQKIMLPEDDEDAVRTGDIWIIPACEDFPLGYSFKIDDFGDAEYAPKAPKDDLYYGQTFSSEKYIYMIVSDPDINEMVSEAFSYNMGGIGGVAFSLLPENTIMEVNLEQENGESMIATVNSGAAVRAGSKDDFPQAGFQMQNLFSNIVPSANVESGKVGMSIKFKDTVIYDKDGHKNTVHDQLSIGGDVTISNMDVEGVLEWHPIKEGGLLPQQVGLVVDYNERKNFKVSLGGKLSEKGTDGEKIPVMTMREIVKAFKQVSGKVSTDNKKDIKLGPIDAAINGVNMENTLVLAAVGFNIGLHGVTVAGGLGYDEVQAQSERAKLKPILVLMLCMDLDGSISCKFAYTYTEESYNAKGFNIVKNGYKETNAKIASLTPSEVQTKGKYEMESFDVHQKSAANKAKPSGKHTFSLTGDANISADLCLGLSMMVWGVNFAQIKGGVYAEADATATGSMVFEQNAALKTKYTNEPVPTFKVDEDRIIAKLENDWFGVLEATGSVSAAAGLIANVSAKISVTNNKSKKEQGVEFNWTGKWKHFSASASSIGISGYVTEPSVSLNQPDAPLADVKVTLHDVETTSNIPDVEFYTDSNGKYSFKNITSGKYKLTFEKDGYETITKTVVVTTRNMPDQNVSMGIAKFMQLEGSVKDASTNQPVSGISFTLTKTADSKYVRYGLSDGEGKFTIGTKDDAKKGVTPGIYRLEASAAGYKPFTQTIVVVAEGSGIVDIGEFSMVKGIYGNAEITGNILDIATGRPTGAALQLTLRKGINNTTSDALDTYILETDGKYSFKVPAGSYTITVEDKRSGIGDNERYHTIALNAAVAADQTTVRDGYVSQAASEDQMRIVLTWGARPSDLDSHLLGPTGDGSDRFHTYYSNKVYRYNNKNYADLDLDDTSSYGPETTTIYYKNGSGIYSYYVHDYSNRGNAASMAMANSDATVKVYQGSALVKTFKVPAGQGTVWHVFDYDAGTGVITPVNTMSNQSNPDSVGRMAFNAALFSESENETENITLEEADLQTIFADMCDKE